MKSGNQALIAAVFLVVGGLLSGAWIASPYRATQDLSSFSTPVLVQTAQAQDSTLAVPAAPSAALAGPLAAAIGNAGDVIPTPSAYANGAIEDSGMPVGPAAGAAKTILESNAKQLAGQSGTFPDFNADFVIPVKGHDLGALHNYNAVDIVAACGTPVFAAADGLVVPDQNNPDVSGGWNGGYGNFVLLEHSFGDSVFTRYAHLAQLSVSVGAYVKQGQEIGIVGKTGDATGCHLHFEVIGAQNPFAKK